MERVWRKCPFYMGLCLMAVGVTGCGEQKARQKTAKRIGRGITVCEVNYCVEEDGIMVLENGGLVGFYDYQIEKYLPLCYRPNCKHQTGACSAVSLATGTDWIGYHEGAVYYCTNREGREPESILPV